MSYLHCPTCACAYNVAREPTCPRCGIKAGTPADPTEDILHAVEQLARAMARATPVELVTAQAILDRRDAQLALPAPGAHAAPSPQLLRAVRAALDPAPAAPASLIEKLFERLSPERRASWRAAASPGSAGARSAARAARSSIDGLLARLAPRLPETTGKQSRRQAMFLFAKSQLTRFHQASMNFGRALR